MSASLFNLQREHLAHLQQAYADLLTNHSLDSLAIYSGHASAHFGDDQTPTFQTYGHFMHWVGMADIQHSWLVIQPASARSCICMRRQISGICLLACLKSHG